LFIPTIVLAELYTWAFHRKNPTPVIQAIERDLLPNVTVLDFDSDCTKEFGKLRGQLLQQGITVSRMDLLIAAVALTHNLTLVTHNTADYLHVPGLRLDDWLTP
jgi:tRNA(fMet)-specific endonuclease VapC